MYSVFIVDDEMIVREGLRTKIDWEKSRFSFAGEAGDGEIALSMIQDIKPDILITDIKMPFMDGLELAQAVKKLQPKISIIILSGHDEFDYAKKAISIGVEDYILKPFTLDEILRCLNRVAEKLATSHAPMATAAHPVHDFAEFQNPNCVKVVLDQRRNALYFSRAPIAWPRDAFAETQAMLPEGFAPLRHIGLYAYRVGFLHQYVGLPPSPLESIESLEQLRVLWHGGKIAVTVCDNAPAAGVDTAEDLQRVRDWFARHPEEAT